MIFSIYDLYYIFDISINDFCNFIFIVCFCMLLLFIAILLGLISKK